MSGTDRISPGELTVVCARYGVKRVKSARPLSIGSASAPKLVLESDRGKLLLKRRSAENADPCLVAVSHEVMIHLRSKGFPAPRILGTTAGNNSMLQVGGNIYEMFEFLDGNRFERTEQQAFSAGATLAQFHNAIVDLKTSWPTNARTYHNDRQVVASLHQIARRNKVDTTPIVALARRYHRAAQRSMRRFNPAEGSLIHGDWHPGNILFSGSHVGAVVDFDTVRTGHRTLDLANGAAQFSLLGGEEDLSLWPDNPSTPCFLAFIRGYHQSSDERLTMAELDALAWLMIEALVAESVGPVVRTGSFGGHEGGAFLAMIDRKTRWFEREGTPLIARFMGVLRG